MAGQKSPTHLSPDHEDIWLSEQRDCLNALSTSNPTFKYSDLTSYQRMKVHELAESLGLKHYSVTQGDSNRVLIVELPKKKDRTLNELSRLQSPKNSPKDRKSSTTAEPPPAETEGETLSSPRAKRDVSEPSASPRDVSDASNSPRSPTTTPSRSRRKQHRNGRKRTDGVGKEDPKVEIEEADDDDLLDRMVAESEAQAERCHWQGCGQSVNILNMKCRHCHMKYCYEHGLPEAHGCGDAARQWAKREKPLNAQQHAIVEKRLKQKLEEERSKRVSKKKTTTK